MGELAPGHLIIVLIVALLVFGPKKLPELGRGLGKGMRDFRNALSGLDDEPVAKVTEAPPAPAAQPALQVAPPAAPTPHAEA